MEPDRFLTIGLLPLDYVDPIGTNIILIKGSSDEPRNHDHRNFPIYIVALSRDEIKGINHK